MPREIRTITVGELRQHLAAFPAEWEVTFAGCLEFFRTKSRGEGVVDIEFTQIISRDRATGDYSIEDPL